MSTRNSPRDDRFDTPRAQALSGRSQASSIADYGTPRTSREDFLSSRSGHFSSSSESEYVTPRMGPSDIRRNSVQRNFQRAKRANYPPFPPNSFYHEQSSRPSRPPLPQKWEPFDGNASESISGKEQSNTKNMETYFEQNEEIFSFARHSRFEEVNDLLLRGVPADIRDHNGNTLLCIACQNGNKRIAKAALRHGADINAKNVSIVIYLFRYYIYREDFPVHLTFPYSLESRQYCSSFLLQVSVHK